MLGIVENHQALSMSDILNDYNKKSFEAINFLRVFAEDLFYSPQRAFKLLKSEIETTPVNFAHKDEQTIKRNFTTGPKLFKPCRQ